MTISPITDIIADITAASAEQSSGIQQVNMAIGQMDDVTQQNAALVEEAAAAAESLAEQARMLSEAVSVFSMGSDSASALEQRIASAPLAVAQVTAPAIKEKKPVKSSTSARQTKPASGAKVISSSKSSDDEWEEF